MAGTEASRCYGRTNAANIVVLLGSLTFYQSSFHPPTPHKNKLLIIKLYIYKNKANGEMGRGRPAVVKGLEVRTRASVLKVTFFKEVPSEHY